jgi:hypothetical protein
MSSLGIDMPSPDDIDYHADRQEQRVRAALKLIDVGDVIATVESRLAEESDPTKHPLYQLTMFLLDRQTAVDGAQLYDDWRWLVLAAIDTCVGELLARED